MKKITTLLVLFFSFAMAVGAWACSDESCLNRNEQVRSKFSRARVVFIGRVLSVDRHDNLQDVEFEVSKVYKGELGETVVLNTERVGTSYAVCGNDFYRGEDYLVYGYGLISKPQDAYSMDACGGAQKLSCAGYDVRKLDGLTRAGQRN